MFSLTNATRLGAKDFVSFKSTNIFLELPVNIPLHNRSMLNCRALSLALQAAKLSSSLRRMTSNAARVCSEKERARRSEGAVELDESMRHAQELPL